MNQIDDSIVSKILISAKTIYMKSIFTLLLLGFSLKTTEMHLKTVD
jgi:hypothetical protein